MMKMRYLWYAVLFLGSLALLMFGAFHLQKNASEANKKECIEIGGDTIIDNGFSTRCWDSTERVYLPLNGEKIK